MYHSIKKQLVVLGVSTVLSGFSLGSIVAFTDPDSGSKLTLTFFYLSLFLVALGIFTFLGLLFRNLFMGGMYATNLSHSFRQAVFVALLLVSSLILQANNLLFWWLEATLILFFLSIEGFLNLKG